ncbi:hypothetical protein LTR85_006919 [Meristemomyces frigidus]|nr:hypothetical protein LTR85_006919 [Meristemomyces frigidus]
MGDLFTGITVDVTVKALPESGESQTFVINRSLLCGYSTYFAGAFLSQFAEAEKQAVELSDVEPWVFRCFLGWLYTRTLCYHAAGTDEPPLSEIFERPVMLEGSTCENDCLDPITWSWTGLVTLYIFADQYDCRRFREAVFEVIHVKAWQELPRSYQPPRPETIDYLCKHTVKENRLRLFFKELWAAFMRRIDISREDEETWTGELGKLPPAFLAECFINVKRTEAALHCIHCADNGDNLCVSTGHVSTDRRENHAWCRYHEHEGDEEKEACVLRYFELRKRMPGRFAEDDDDDDDDDDE